VELSDQTTAEVKFRAVNEVRAGLRLRSATRQAHVKIDVTGPTATLVSANSRIPITIAGVQIDCLITRLRVLVGY
jgi:hypothetical protein